MVFRLRYLHHDFELPPGRFLIGRSTECQLSLDDPLVSRKHALLVVALNQVELRDLDSRNGVLVNGERITRPHVLTDGDRITIGSQELLLSCPPVRSGRRKESETRGPETVTSLGALRPSMDSFRDGITEQPPQHVRSETPLDPSDDATGTDKRGAFELLGGLADKALALGRAEEAERLLSKLLNHILVLARGDKGIDAAVLDKAGYYGAKLAGATGKPKWIDYVIEIHMLSHRPCSSTTIDELHRVLRKVKDVNLPALRGYLDLLHEMSSELGPADRFLVQRMEGLVRLARVQ